jgi:drug/metabolite transporter (DMT)-like permease
LGIPDSEERTVGLGVTVLILIWGTTFAAVRIGLETVPPFTGIAIRFAIAAAILFAGARAFGIVWRGDGDVWGLWVFNATCHFVIPYGVVYWCVQWLPSGLAAVLFSTFPLFVALLAHLVLPGERLRWLSSAGVVVGFVGVAVIYSDDLGALAEPEARLAAWVFLLSPLASAVGDVAIKKYWSRVHPVSLTAPSLAITAAIAALLALLLERGREVDLTLKAWVVLVYLALFGTALAFVVYFRLLARIRVTGLSLIAYAIPVVALVVGTVWLDEVITSRVLVGAGLVLLGVWAALRRDSRPIAA